MSLDSDVVLLGSGVAPLVAANHLLSHGKSVLILNPDWDFFDENSELSFDPFWPMGKEILSPDRLKRNDPVEAAEILRLDFPGAIEVWHSDSKKNDMGFRDKIAPHVRGRSRLWMKSEKSLSSTKHHRYWEEIEDFYLEASEFGLSVQVLESMMASRLFPGYSGIGQQLEFSDQLRGILAPRFADVDVIRFRNGLLEYVRHKLSSKRVICSASQIELIPEGVRFRYRDDHFSRGSVQTAKIGQGLLVFWTPKISQWIGRQLNIKGNRTVEEGSFPKKVRVWEEWSVLSKEKLNPGVIGMFEDMAVWAKVEGAPDDSFQSLNRMSILRAGQKIDFDQFGDLSQQTDSASEESIHSVERLCKEFLKWEKVTICSMFPRVLFEWDQRGESPFFKDNFECCLVSGCDGPLVDVVSYARSAAERYL